IFGTVAGPKSQFPHSWSNPHGLQGTASSVKITQQAETRWVGRFRGVIPRENRRHSAVESADNETSPFPPCHQGFESGSRRARWLSGRKRRFAKPVYGSNRTAGSNPVLSVKFNR